MTKRNPYQIIINRHVTEKSFMLQSLQEATSNPSLTRCKSPKYVFIVARSANKQEIAKAIEEIYADEGIKVVGVNTINVKSKPRRVRGRVGSTSSFKKAVVTLRPGDKLDNV